MLFDWRSIDRPAPLQTQATKQVRYETLTIRFKTSRQVKSTIVFDGGIEATYGPTRLTAKRLTLNIAPDQRKGVAEGDVHVYDPDGEAVADEFDFNWKDKSGTLIRTKARFANLRVEAKKISITPERWDVTDYSVTNSPERKPFYRLNSKVGYVIPGKRMVIERPYLRTLGQKIGPLPKITANFDKRTAGIGFPTFGYHAPYGFGFGWGGSGLLDSRTALAAGFSAFTHQSLSYGLVVSRTFLSPESADHLIIPHNDFDERWGQNYFENVLIRDPRAEELSLRAGRRTFSVGTNRNLTGNDRDFGYPYVRTLDVAFERSGVVGDVGYFGQARFESLSREQIGKKDRELATVWISPPSRKVARYTRFFTRMDLAGYFGPTEFGWGRAQAGFATNPTPRFGIGVAGFVGGQEGTELYPIDRLPIKKGVDGRIDLSNGPTRFSILDRYDLEHGHNYDVQYSISQIMGGFEGFFNYRRNFGTYSFGLKIRLDDFLDVASRRSPARPQKP